MPSGLVGGFFSFRRGSEGLHEAVPELDRDLSADSTARSGKAVASRFWSSALTEAPAMTAPSSWVRPTLMLPIAVMLEAAVLTLVAARGRPRPVPAPAPEREAVGTPIGGGHRPSVEV
jgi:hypothetical protein